MPRRFDHIGAMAAIWRYRGQMTSHRSSHSRSFEIDHIFHADWSLHEKGRWVTHAKRVEDGQGWQIDRITPLGDLADFHRDLTALAANTRIWLGLDMPLGFCQAFFDQTGIVRYTDLLDRLTTPDWQDFFAVCNNADEIRPTRPFYPAHSGPKGTVKRQHLADAFGLETFDQLHRTCERRTRYRNAACPPFWTLGANQVGKALLHGLRHLILPGRAAGYRIWPFDGDLAECSVKPGVTLIETYPGEVYHWLNIPDNTPNFRKSDQTSRQQALANLIKRLPGWNVSISPDLQNRIENGFTDKEGKDDAFDSLIGVMGLIRIAMGQRTEFLPGNTDMTGREGWIVGLDPDDIL